MYNEGFGLSAETISFGKRGKEVKCYDASVLHSHKWTLLARNSAGR
jgi:hypothetical protein